MFASLKIARPFGIDVFIHWTFWLLPLWTIYNWDDSSPFPLSIQLLLIAALFACVVLHELGHALMARHFGIATHKIILSPLGGIAQLDHMSRHPWEEFCIAIAGPAVNVIIAGVLGVMLVVGIVVDPHVFDSLAGSFLGFLLVLNVVMVLFNLVPAFPMDGGRVFRAILANSLGLLEGTRVAVIVGTAVALLMGTAGADLSGNPWLLFIALFVIWAGFQELRGLEDEARERQVSDEADLFASSPRPVRPFTAIWIWDPLAGAWVRRTMPDSGRFV